MSRLLITIDTDNDASQENGWQQEAARVRTQLAARLAYTTATATRPARSAIPPPPISEPEIIIPTSQSDDAEAVSSREARETDGETSVAP